MSWPLLIVLTWAVSGTLNHCLSLATHELSHNLAFVETWKNHALGFLCNLAMGFPSTVTFRKYHLEHHQFQGVEGIDTDIPTNIEAKLIRNGRFTKFLFLCLQPMFYALRPQIANPKSAGWLETLNWILVWGSDALIFYFFGFKPIFYLVVGTLMGLSLHPMAGHFLAEHYVWEGKTETFSYYGPLNIFGWNVGYHMEHHDFPRIPGSRLPKLHKIAKEFYPVNPQYQSWVGVMWNFVMDNEMGSRNRVMRTEEVHKTGVRQLRDDKDKVIERQQ
jgi:sphingolipid delta-4 desaturase